MHKSITLISISFLISSILLGQGNGKGCDKVRNGTFYYYPMTGEEYVLIRMDTLEEDINLTKADTTFWQVTWKENCVCWFNFLRETNYSERTKAFFASHLVNIKILKADSEYYTFSRGLDSVNSRGRTRDTVWFKREPSHKRDGKADLLQRLKATMDSADLYNIEIAAHFPGGDSAWQKYMARTFRYPAKGLRDGIEGVVMVKFTVDRDGTIIDVQATSGPIAGGLREEAERVLRESPKWQPAIQHSKYVQHHLQQPIIFKIPRQ